MKQPGHSAIDYTFKKHREQGTENREQGNGVSFIRWGRVIAPLGRSQATPKIFVVQLSFNSWRTAPFPAMLNI
ncbi:hypothetical protein DP115_26455 [Brasilonema octagenarum UFV-OR1]|uniref:Transposase n=1 Tax=Brasilonema octagenarum UFV-OR1 TaxID=417115 RepID=A0ABX1MC31_9CYAN|nr:hypothetical protein [Brasilonema octagenarum UFV-OR1]